MLELENLVTIKKGSGVYVIGLPDKTLSEQDKKMEEDDFGPFEFTSQAIN